MDSLFGGKCQNHLVCADARQGWAECLPQTHTVAAQNVKIHDCLFKKKKSQPGRAGNQMSHRIMVFGEIPQGPEGSGYGEGGS